MRQYSLLTLFISTTCGVLASSQVNALSFFDEGYQRISGNVSFDVYYYDQKDSKGSPPSIVPTLSLQPEYYKEWGDGDVSFTFIPFIRLTEHGNTSADYDIRELNVAYSGIEDWTFKAGFDREFWGVTESTNKVDVLNQVDLAGTLGGIQKLGQPMFKISLTKDYGEFSAYWLPYFRTRTFPSPNSALGDIPSVEQDKENVAFEAKDRRWHQDYAFRWTHTIGDFDFGLSWFDGVDRTPIILPRLDPETGFVLFKPLSNVDQAGRPAEIDVFTCKNNLAPAFDSDLETFEQYDKGRSVDCIPKEIIPGYVLKKQIGFELQYTKGSWIFKMEATAVRSFKEEAKIPTYVTVRRDYGTFVGGVEYVIPELLGTPADLTLFAEYMRDSRGAKAVSLFQKDIFFAGRLNFNDDNGTDMTFGLIKDLGGDETGGETILSFGAGRRIGDDWRIGLSGQTFFGLSKQRRDRAFGIRNVKFVQFQIKRFF